MESRPGAPSACPRRRRALPVGASLGCPAMDFESVGPSIWKLPLPPAPESITSSCGRGGGGESRPVGLFGTSRPARFECSQVLSASGDTMPASPDLARFRDPALRPVAEKVLSGRRLDPADGLALYETSDVLSLGELAAFANKRVNGDRVFFSANQHINPTNVCIL